MANEALLIYKKMGISEESDWAAGTITAASKLLPLRDSGIAVGLAPQQIMPNRLYGDSAGRRDMILGTIAPSLTIPAFGYPVGASPLLLKAALGQASSLETASFTVVDAGPTQNDKIDFNEGAGALVATVAAGTYRIGSASTEAGTLCAAIKTAMDLAGGTYSVAFDRTTKKMTITKSEGSFTLLWQSGANTAKRIGGLIGWAATDTSSAAAHEATSAVEIVFAHTITVHDALAYGQTKGLTAQIMLASGKVFDVLDCVVNALNISYAPNQELWIDASMEARRVDDSAADLAALTVPGTKPLIFTQLAAEIDGSPAVLSGLTISFSNSLKTDLFANSPYRTRFVRGGFREVTGSLSFDITDSRTYDLYDAFRADDDGVSLEAAFEGAVIKGSHKYAISFDLPAVKPNFDSVPGGGGADAPAGEVPFVALHDGTDSEMSVTITNNEAAI